MSRPIRYFPPASLVEVTCRTIQGRLLMTPTPVVRDLTLGVLARAARLYPVEVHAFVFLSNHFHLLVTVASAHRLAQFMNYLNSNLAREVGRIVHWRERFWGRRYQAILVSKEEAAQVGRLQYLLSHGSKEHLVGRPEEWPGAHCAAALAQGRPVTGTWIDRTLAFRAARATRRLRLEEFASEEILALSPLPCWSHLPERKYRERVQAMLREIEAATFRRSVENGLPPLGPARVLLQDPQDRSTQAAKRPAPPVHAATHQVRRELRGAYRAFVAAFRRAAALLRAGRLDAEFPAGCFPPGLPFVAAARPG